MINKDIFENIVDGMIKAVKNSGHEGIDKQTMYPGEPEHIREERRTSGIALNGKVYQGLIEVANELGVNTSILS